MISRRSDRPASAVPASPHDGADHFAAANALDSRRYDIITIAAVRDDEAKPGEVVGHRGDRAGVRVLGRRLRWTSVG